MNVLGGWMTVVGEECLGWMNVLDEWMSWKDEYLGRIIGLGEGISSKNECLGRKYEWLRRMIVFENECLRWIIS